LAVTDPAINREIAPVVGAEIVIVKDPRMAYPAVEGPRRITDVTVAPVKLIGLDDESVSVILSEKSAPC